VNLSDGGDRLFAQGLEEFVLELTILIWYIAARWLIHNIVALERMVIFDPLRYFRPSIPVMFS